MADISKKFNKNLSYGHLPTTGDRCERPGLGHRKDTAGHKEPMDFDNFLRLLVKQVEHDEFTAVLQGKIVRLNPKWLRDYIYEMRAFKHWDGFLKEYLTLVAENQDESGFFYEMLQRTTDYHVKVGIAKYFEDEDLALSRLELSADIEYLMVEGTLYAYQATGDKIWLSQMLPHLEKGIDYNTSHEKRWDEEHGLVKRVFTVDTFDFTTGVHADGERPRDIHPDSYISVFYGDNTGVYSAMKILAKFNKILGNVEKAVEWERRAAKLLENINKYLWNGKTYTHMLHLNHLGKDNLEKERLTLSTPHSINRGATTKEQTSAIFAEYFKRMSKKGENTFYEDFSSVCTQSEIAFPNSSDNGIALNNSGTFAEWFTIDPPYEYFGSDAPTGASHYKAGEYINGSVSSVAAGQLALAAFNNGYEHYGWYCIQRLIELAKRDERIYFMYDPKTSEDVNGGPIGWGAAEIIAAVDEGLAGIKDLGAKYDKMFFSPKWVVTGRTEIKYLTGYEISGTVVTSDYRYDESEGELFYKLLCPSKSVKCHILLPRGKGKICKKVELNGENVNFTISCLNSSEYVDFEFTRESVFGQNNVEAHEHKCADAVKAFEILIKFCNN